MKQKWPNTAQYRSKPKTFTAVQWTGDNFKEIMEFTADSVDIYVSESRIVIPTSRSHNGCATGVHRGDYIILRESGDLEAVPQGVFEIMYEVDPD